MGIWDAAKRGEGYQLARESNITWVIVVLGGIIHFFWRYFTGKPMFGDEHRKTNAQWSRPGTKIYREMNPTTRLPIGWNDGNPAWYCWSAMTERRRAFIRLMVFIFIVSTVWIWWNGGAPFSSYVWTAAIAFPILLVGNWKIVNLYLDWRHQRQVIKPLEATIAPITGKTPADITVRIPRTRKAS